MICKNCNYILSGNESFCPDCGTPCERDRSYRKEEQPPQVIFSPEKESASPVFAAASPVVTMERTEKKSKAGLYLIIVLCAVILGTVLVSVTDMVDLTPVIASLFPSGEDEAVTQVPAAETEFNPLSGIVSPSVSYKTTTGFISSDAGQALRKGPGNSYGQIDILPSGTVIHIIGCEKTDGEWIYVYIPEMDIYGWLSSSYISTSRVDMYEDESEIYEETEPTSDIADAD